MLRDSHAETHWSIADFLKPGSSVLLSLADGFISRYEFKARSMTVFSSRRDELSFLERNRRTSTSPKYLLMDLTFLQRMYMRFG